MSVDAQNTIAKAKMKKLGWIDSDADTHRRNAVKSHLSYFLPDHFTQTY